MTGRRVLFVIGSGRPGGRELQLGALAPKLASKGWDVGVVFSVTGGPVADDLRDAGISVLCPQQPIDAPTGHRLGRLVCGVFRRGRAASTIRAAVREFRPDIVHAMLPMSVWLGLPLVRRHTSVRIAGVYGDWPKRIRPSWFLYRRQLRRADAVLCNAPHLVEQMVTEHRVAPARVRWIANGVDIPDQGADVTVQPPTAVVVANFRSYKGYDVLVEAIAQAEADVVVRCCGTGDERESTRSRAEELGVASRIVLVEPPADVAAELSRAQFAIHPSRTEGLSNAILEQMSAGLPVVACDVGGNRLLIEDGFNGLLVAPGDAPALAGAISALAHDVDMRDRMGRAARERAECFSWDSCVQLHIRLYDDLLGQVDR
jgi:glycosyltransferase involved in cell wall biosynthesis